MEKEDFVPLSQRDHLSIGRMVCIAAGWFANSINWTLIFALSTPLFERLKITGIPATMVWFAGAVIVFIFQPLSGAYSDQCTSRWGRRRIWVVGSMILIVVGMLFVMFSVNIAEKIYPGTDAESVKKFESTARGIIIPSLLIWYLGASTFQGPMRALASDSCPVNQQMVMSNICNIINTISALLVNLIGALSLYKYTPFKQEEFLILIGTILAVFTIIVSCFAAPEQPLFEKPPNVANPFVQIARQLKKIPKSVLIISIEYGLSQCAFYEKGVFETAFFATTIYGGDNDYTAGPEANQKYQDGLSFAMMVACIMNGTNFLYGLVNTIIIDKIGMKLSYGLSMVLSSIGFLLVLWIRNKWVLLFMWIIFGVGSVLFNTVPNAVTALSVKQDDLASYLGIVNSVNVIGQQVSNFVIGMGFGSLWSEPYKKIACGCVPAIASAIGAFFIIVPNGSTVVEHDEEDSNESKSDSDRPEAL
ncbi:major facilitator superfamily transporter [Tritrichomonas foetus]|uniref:Major facilitator superfamily transporter n=1 Tax=Tritrichomonas foetus TaxID=1144522 RepID=A0A1J4KQF6_9EUKA|nr:major facilitator superfamily transporter [Tritrichomonas foetus]|eukprot:OHT13475.1 major facilitator superfamily transporter [Tritrichomonas foetus]